MSLYEGSQHQTFESHPREPSKTGALLLHGFTGTPAELRPLGTALVEQGISVYGPLLPGSGKNFSRLGKVKHQEWFRAARDSWDQVQREYETPLLIGFSMGAAIAIDLAADAPPQKLVLLAPFWKLAVPRAATMLSLLRFFHRDLRPFEREPNGSPELRDALIAIDPESDPDDPATQSKLRREYVIPSTSLLELTRAGQRAGNKAAKVTAPTLVIQGTDDNTVLPEYTRSLVQMMPSNPRVIEVEGDHQLVRTNRPAWSQVRDAVVEFVKETN